MRVSVSKFVGTYETEPTRALLDLRGYYQFSHRFCNAYRGNEKGHVERSVEYIRRKTFGLKACMQGYKVLFTSVHKILTQIRESNSQRTLRQLAARFEKYDLVIRDEFGYVSFDKNGAELLFNHLSLMAGRKSTIITTNLGFDRWDEIFGDAVLTAALVDRLTHKAFLINMNGESYRLKETKEMNQK